jgi:glycosyltransferase involved in cell wall biosynthesis
MHVVILTYRVAGNDGVSLEAVRWGEIFKRMGYKVTFLAGQLDRGGVVIPELYFNNPKVTRLHDKVIYSRGTYRKIEREVFELAGVIEGRLRETFNKNGKIDLLVIANALSLPMHFPLAVALTRVIEEHKIPTISRHHDFWWERERFMRSTMFEFFKRWFPPDSPYIKHVVINSIARKELKKRTGIDAEVIWDSFDYRSDLNKIDAYSKNWRKDFNIGDDDIVFLQATRIVPRKRIELSVELVKKLRNPKTVLVLAGYSGDEAGDYEDKIRRLVKRSKIRCRFIEDQVSSQRKIAKIANGKKPIRKRIYTLWDCFVNSDFVTYPTEVEGFGNQFVEAIYFKKPIIVAPYPVYKADIAPLGFQTITMPHRVADKVLDETWGLINNPEKRNKMVDENYELGKKYFSYTWVEKKLQKLLRKTGLS